MGWRERRARQEAERAERARQRRQQERLQGERERRERERAAREAARARAEEERARREARALANTEAAAAFVGKSQLARERGDLVSANANPNPDPDPDPNPNPNANPNPNPNQERGGAPHARLGAPSERELEGALLALLCSLAEAEAARGGGRERVLLVRWALRLPAEAEAPLLRRWQAGP